MKFFYFKDSDVLGPLEAEKIAEKDFFSSELLVCPEDKAENQDAWKFAKDYPEFESLIPNTQESVSQDLPALEDTKTDSDPDFIRKMDIGANKPSFEGRDFTTELVNIPQGYTFHVDYKQGKDTEDVPLDNLLGEKKPSAVELKKMQETNHSEPLPEDPLKSGNNAILNDSFLEISNNKIISSSDGRVKNTKKNDLIFILSFAVITIVAVAICLAFFNMNQNKAEKDIAFKPDLTEEETLKNLPFVADMDIVQEENVVGQKALTEQPVSLENQAISIVQNTMLSGKGKTIEVYFKEIYGDDYQTSWSAKPFTQKTYIVEFFASKVRNEPFVYLFRVDMDKKEITGALNNITLDLLS